MTDQPVPDPHDERNANPSGLPDGDAKKVAQPIPAAPTDPDDTAGTPV